MKSTVFILIITALLGYTSTSIAADMKPYCLPGMDPIADKCEVLKEEPKKEPIWKSIPKEQLCLSYQRVAVKLTALRDKGAREEDVARALQDNGRTDMIWIARQVYWSQSARMTPEKIGFSVWMRCDEEKYPKQ